MTPAELEKLVLSGDPEKLAQAVAPLTEKERLELSGAASELRRILDKMTKSIKGRTSDKLPGLVIMAQLAMLAVSEVRRVPAHSCAAKILRDRQPERLDGWIEEILKDEWPEIQWETLRELMRDGVAKKPTSKGYVRLMVQSLPDPWHVENYRPLSQKILEDPDLLGDELWQLFKIETEAFTVDQSDNNPHAPANYESWSTAVLKLAADGKIDRQRLLDAILSGLRAAFKKATLAGYLKLHEGLKPSLAELSARQLNYLDLLTSEASHVVTFALEKLKALDEGERLDGPGLLESIGRVFGVRAKAQPKTALDIIERVVKREPDLTVKATRLAAGALAHYAPDVQERALILLEGWADQVDPTLVSLLEERSLHVSRKHRGRLAQLVARLGGQAGGAAQDVAAIDPGLLNRAAPLSPEAQASAEVDAVLGELADGATEALDANFLGASSESGAVPVEPTAAADRPGDGVPLDALDSKLLDASVLSGAVPVEPIASVDELIDAVTHAVEGVDSATEAERILDGISRLCDQRPEDFESRTAPLVKLIKEEGGSESNGLLRSWGVPRALSCVVMVWLVRARPRVTPDPHNPEKGARKAITGRLLELARRVVRGVAAPLLAAPTHARGWIDPGRFVERVLELQKSRLEVPRLDLVQALLRLAPDGRSKALEDAKSIDKNVGRIVRWALGGDANPTREDRRDSPLWVAAGRSRTPRGNLEELAALDVSEQIPDAVTPATYSWTASNIDSQLILESEPRVKAVAMEEFPSTSLHEHASQYSVLGVQSPWLVEWISMLWPLNQDAFLAAGATTISRSIDVESSSFEPVHPFLAPLLESARPWSEMALLTEWLGLVSKSGDTRRVAIDALVEGIKNDRVHPATLSRVLVRLNVGGWIKLDRVASALGEVASDSALARSLVGTTLENFVVSLETMPSDVHHVLSLLLEVLTELGLGVNDLVRDALTTVKGPKTVKGPSKTDRVAKALLELVPRADLVREA